MPERIPPARAVKADRAGARPAREPCPWAHPGARGDVYTNVLTAKVRCWQNTLAIRGPPALQFEWDAAKSRANVRKHGIAFSDAVRVFDAPLLVRQEGDSP